MNSGVQWTRPADVRELFSLSQVGIGTLYSSCSSAGRLHGSSGLAPLCSQAAELQAVSRYERFGSSWRSVREGSP